MGGRPAAFGRFQCKKRRKENSVLCSVLEVTKSKYGISSNAETPYLRSLLVEVTGLEPTAPTSRKHRWRCCDLLRFDVSRSSARFAGIAPAVFRCDLVRSRAGCEGCGVLGVS